MVKESGADVLFYNDMIDVIKEENVVEGVIASNKAGLQAFLADVVIDCTGDADVAAKAGAQFTVGRKKDEMTQPMTVMFKMNDVEVPELVQYVAENPEDFLSHHIPETDDYRFKFFTEGYLDLIKEAKRKGEFPLPRRDINVKTCRGKNEVMVNATRVIEGIGTDPEELSKAVEEGFKQVEGCVNFLKKYVPGFEDAYLSGIAPHFGIRETRHIVGEYTLTVDDIREGKSFKDSIGAGECILEIHEPGGERLEWEQIRRHGIPYRCLVPKEIEGLLIASRSISADHLAHASTRNIPVVMAVGEAAGTAAAISSERKFTPGRLI